ncbi:hypothetical protein AOCH_003464 [Aspergillus ochraceoroseus]|uniref:phosphatidylinositol-3,4,5-trisphosphate 3-phosphatase n=1 Tax=Aspergillus ochraceoroseus TaxID=138278 RepID=A0A0F8WX00_9EURO|nr:hypothetical protein AOCH_003464 [Aspergillus ochraceoroseus]
MQLTSLITIAVSIWSATTASAFPIRITADNPALTWHVSEFDVGCSPGGCVYTFNIYGIGTINTPAFNTTCTGTTVEQDYVKCKDPNVFAQVVPQLYPTWQIKAKHHWRQGDDADFYALGQANITSGTAQFTIPVTEIKLGLHDTQHKASILRQIVAGPRLQHPEAGLDLCYVTDEIIATSGPSSNYPKLAYRTPLRDLVNFLDAKHGADWCIWEFRAEGTGYPDSEVYGRIHHFPFPDHHPPPFALIPKVMASMRNWLHRLEDSDPGEGPKGEDKDKDNEKWQRVAVVHCKAGKGRSGTISCAYLISQEGWTVDDALQRFTERRMRVGFGSGVSIPSQVRWVRYVDRWTNQMGKKYVERPVEILELHVWGLRDGVKVAVEGFVEGGQKIKCFHLFRQDEHIVMDTESEIPNGNSHANDTGRAMTPPTPNALPSSNTESVNTTTTTSSSSSSSPSPIPKPPASAVLLRPSAPILLPTCDVNIDFERRSKAAYTGLGMVTSIAHVWFNTYFEGGDKHDSGVFEIEWDALDGIKGTTKKGIRALDRLNVVWRYASPSTPGGANAGAAEASIITEPKPGEPIPESHPADWRLLDTAANENENQNEDKDAAGDDDTEEQSARNQENVPMQALETVAAATGETKKDFVEDK